MELELAVDRFRQAVARFPKATMRAHGSFACEFFDLPTDALWRGRTLILRSDDDPSRRGRPDLTAAYPDAELVELPGAGHLGSLLHTDRYLDVCRRFLGQLDSQR